jgi:hypothetical protein
MSYRNFITWDETASKMIVVQLRITDPDSEVEGWLRQIAEILAET